MRRIKRLLDTFFSVVGIIFFLPLFLFLAVVIKISSQGPVFYSQDRIGKAGHRFKIYKFRTMIVNAENKGAGVFVVKNDSRITRIGKLLRHTSLDELPQLFNILRGEMSFVGPRPTLSYQVEKYDQRQYRRLSATPGLTGWAQVNGRNSLSWVERIEYDLWYVDNWSLWLDVKIFFQTFNAVLNESYMYKDSNLIDPISFVPDCEDSD